MNYHSLYSHAKSFRFKALQTNSRGPLFVICHISSLAIPTGTDGSIADFAHDAQRVLSREKAQNEAFSINHSISGLIVPFILFVNSNNSSSHSSIYKLFELTSFTRRFPYASFARFYLPIWCFCPLTESQWFNFLELLLLSSQYL